MINLGDIFRIVACKLDDWWIALVGRKVLYLQSNMYLRGIFKLPDTSNYLNSEVHVELSSPNKVLKELSGRFPKVGDVLWADTFHLKVIRIEHKDNPYFGRTRLALICLPSKGVDSKIPK